MFRCSVRSIPVVMCFAFAIMGAARSPAALAAIAPKEDSADQLMVDVLYSQFKGTTAFLVTCSLMGSAKEIGLTQNAGQDRTKLRLVNTISSVPILKSDLRAESAERRTKPAVVSVTIWTVGTDFPVAYHVEITASCIGVDGVLFNTAVLGYGDTASVPDAVYESIDSLVDKFAIAFHKGVGDF